MDIGTIIGLALGLIAVVGGQVLEGGHVSSIMVPTAALIVFGGTIGAVVLQFPMSYIMKVLPSILGVILPKKEDSEALIKQIVEFSKKARREGVLTLEKELKAIEFEFFKKSLTMVIDGLEPKAIHETMETELQTYEEEENWGGKVLEAMGGYSPTVGIIGAVLGLIHVMGNLSDPSKLGGGIAVAFVATIYGVYFANLVCLPLAGKIKTYASKKVKYREIALRGTILIQEGINHSIIEEELKGFLNEKQRKGFVSSKDA